MLLSVLYDCIMFLAFNMRPEMAVMDRRDMKDENNFREGEKKHSELLAR